MSKSWDILQNLVDEGSSTSSLKSLSITRWSARDDACQALKHRWQNVLDALQIISDDSTQKPSTRAEAKGLIVALNRLETAIMTEVWGFILDRLNASNKQLQKVDIDLSSVVGIYTSLVELLKTRDNFEFFEEKGKKLSNTETYESENKRKRKRKMQCDETNENAAELTARDKFKIDTYLVIVDKLLAELNKRLEAYKDVYDKFKAVIEIEKLSLIDLEKAAIFLCSQFPQDLEESLVSELIHLSSYLKILEDVNPTNPAALLKWLRKEELECIYPNVDIALRIFLCIPVANCTAERSFSCLKRIKNYLRSTMTEYRLNSLALLCIEENYLSVLDYTIIIDEFAHQKARRKILHQ